MTHGSGQLWLYTGGLNFRLMPSRNRHAWLPVLVLLMAALVWLPAPSIAADDAAANAERQVLVLVVSPGLRLNDMSSALVQRVFRGEPTDLAGRRMLPFNYAPDHALRQTFDRLVLRMTPDEVGRYWVDRRIRGQGMPPRTVPSAAVARAVAAKLPGAITYVTTADVDASVRVLSIDGKAPDDPDYPLR
jgi:hypothetical protein